MWRFIRRLFVLLILFTISFLVYRYINPVGASILVEKVKAIPDKISEFVWSDKQEEINIIGTTLTITWDVDVLIENVEDNINVNAWINTDVDETDDDLTWLEELNLEIEKILWTNDSWTWELLEEEFTENEEILTWNLLTGYIEETNELTWANGKEVNLDEETEELTWVVVTWSNIDDVDSTPAWLTDADYQQMEDIFGNLVE